MVVVRVISNSAALSAPRKAALKEEKINSFEKRKDKFFRKEKAKSLVLRSFFFN
jgi:hypothetical protein